MLIHFLSFTGIIELVFIGRNSIATNLWPAKNNGALLRPSIYGRRSTWVRMILANSGRFQFVVVEPLQVFTVNSIKHLIDLSVLSSAKREGKRSELL
jgi:hypothetical protein